MASLNNSDPCTTGIPSRPLETAAEPELDSKQQTQQYNLRKRKSTNSRSADAKRVKHNQTNTALMKVPKVPTGVVTTPSPKSSVRTTKQTIGEIEVFGTITTGECDSSSSSSSRSYEDEDSQTAAAASFIRKAIAKRTAISRQGCLNRLLLPPDLTQQLDGASHFNQMLNSTNPLKPAVLDSPTETTVDRPIPAPALNPTDGDGKIAAHQSHSRVLSPTSNSITRNPVSRPSDESPVDRFDKFTSLPVEAETASKNSKIVTVSVARDAAFDCSIVKDKRVVVDTRDSLRKDDNKNQPSRPSASPLKCTGATLLAHISGPGDGAREDVGALYPPPTSAGPCFKNIRVSFMIFWSFQVAKHFREILHQKPITDPNASDFPTLSQLTNALYPHLDSLFAYLDLTPPELILGRSIFFILRDTMKYYASLFDSSSNGIEFRSDDFVGPVDINRKPKPGNWLNPKFSNWLIQESDAVIEKIRNGFRVGESPTLGNYQHFERNTQLIFVLGVLSMTIDTYEEFFGRVWGMVSSVMKLYLCSPGNDCFLRTDEQSSTPPELLANMEKMLQSSILPQDLTNIISMIVNSARKGASENIYGGGTTI